MCQRPSRGIATALGEAVAEVALTGLGGVTRRYTWSALGDPSFGDCFVSTASF